MSFFGKRCDDVSSNNLVCSSAEESPEWKLAGDGRDVCHEKAEEDGCGKTFEGTQHSRLQVKKC